jgi:hypothetical protein
MRATFLGITAWNCRKTCPDLQLLRFARFIADVFYLECVVPRFFAASKKNSKKDEIHL